MDDNIFVIEISELRTGFGTVIVRCALGAIPPERDPRVMQCVQAIRRYVNWIADVWPTGDYYNELREAVAELSSIALDHREVFVGDRLQQIAKQLEQCDANGIKAS